MAGVYQWFKRFGGAIASLAALLTAAVMCNDSVLDYTRTTLSESSFFPALIWSAVLLQRLLVERDGRRSIILCVLAAVLVSYLVIVRQLGIFVLGGYGMAGLWLAVHHRLSWPRLILTCAALALPAGVVMFAWSMHQKDVAAAQHLPSHFGYIKLAPADILEAVRMRVTEIGRLIVPGMHKAGAPAGRWLHPNTLLLFPVGLFMLVQWARTVRTVGVDVLLLTWPFYLLFLCTWPYDQSTRYAMPFLPVFVLAVCVMLELIRVRQTIVVLFTLATLLTGLIGWASEVPKSWRENRSWADVDAIVAEITDRSAPIAATEPRAHAQRVAFTIQKAIPIIDPRKDEVTSRWFILDPKLAAPAGYTPRVTTKTMTLAERSK